ncbi:MAG: SGNH/GDSL hydrolase family protein [Phycisphaerales bacterium]|nr:SGNH/GDSL hydrolase family protein [Phycisphaerales bacterium]
MASAISLGAFEAPYIVDPRLPSVPHLRIAVVGDSLSAGIGGGVTTWPDRLARDIGAEVRNLAVPGATVATARQQVEGVRPDTQVAILLIGGNDVLSRRPIADFECDLQAIVARVKAVVPTTLMFELPTVVFSADYLAVQRRIAAKHHVPLIPRRHLAWVLAERGSTIDGLHLSDRGHQRMADTIRAILNKSMK